jgi:hypothetical protein
MTRSRLKGIDSQAAGAAAAALRASGNAQRSGAPDPNVDLILGGGSFIDPKDRKTQRFVLSAVEPAARRVSLVPTDFLPHGVAIDPLQPTRIVAFEKIGPHSLEIDLASGEPCRALSPASGRWFYGHGAFSADGKRLYSTETIRAEERGVVGVRDAATLEYLGEFPTYGENPHDCELLEGGSVLAITNGGGPAGGNMQPSVTYVEVASERLLEKVELADPRFNAGHLAVPKSQGLVVVSAPRKGLADSDVGAVSIRRPGEPLHTMTEPPDIAARMTGEALSVQVHEPSGIVAVTHPLGAMVTFWSLRDARLVKVLDLPRARGLALTLDSRRFVVSYGTSTEVALIDPETLELDATVAVSRSFLSGSHLFNWSRLAKRPVPASPRRASL